MNSIIGRNIRAHRERLSWTQEQLAAAAEVSVRTVQRAEEGHLIAPESLQALAGALDVPPEVLRLDHDDPALQERLKEARSRFKFIDLTVIERGADFRQFLPVGAFRVDCVGVKGEVADDAVGCLEQSLKDIIDIWRDLEPIQRRECLGELQDAIDALRRLGLAVTAGVDQIRLRPSSGGDTFTVEVLYVVTAPATEPKLFAIRDKTAAVSFE